MRVTQKVYFPEQRKGLRWTHTSTPRVASWTCGVKGTAQPTGLQPARARRATFPLPNQSVAWGLSQLVTGERHARQLLHIPF